MIFIAILIGCILGALIGLNAPMISYTYSSYLAIAVIAALDSFYENEFQQAKQACGFSSWAKKIVDLCQDRGPCILATNPIFPQVATHSRIRWAGLDPDNFEFITTYENSTTCKPNPQYYREITGRLGLDPARCLMIGNDVAEDMIAKTLGMDTFLVTDCLINSKNEDLSGYRRGTLQELYGWLMD